MKTITRIKQLDKEITRLQKILRNKEYLTAGIRIDITIETDKGSQSFSYYQDVAKEPQTVLEAFLTGLTNTRKWYIARAQEEHEELQSFLAETDHKEKPTPPTPYKDLLINGVRQTFRWINPGRFLMGSPDDEPERFKDETQHPVILTRGYWLADTACTQALWEAVMGNNPSRFRDDPRNPVENVSWNDVQDFITRLNALVPSLDARLPTEAEWENACRAGTETPFNFGASITPKQVNYSSKYPYAGKAKSPYQERTVPVQSLPPNAWGLYEMHGNVWEWCADWSGTYPSEEAVDPTGPPEGAERVLRGGSWVSHGRFARSASRFAIVPGRRDDGIGFRLALDGHP